MACKKTYEDYITDEIKVLIPQWKRQGQTDDWIAKKLGVGKNKIIEWKKEQREFWELFKNGKEQLLLELEETLYTRAKGSLIQEKEITTSGGRQTIKLKEKYIWSDKCLEMALKRLAPEVWGDKLNNDLNSEASKVFEELKEALKNEVK